MKIWTGRERPVPGPPYLAVDARRWTFVIEHGHVGFVEERRLKEDGRWIDCRYAGVWLVAPERRRVARESFWCDGPHEVLTLGPMQLSWDVEDLGEIAIVVGLALALVVACAVGWWA